MRKVKACALFDFGGSRGVGVAQFVHAGAQAKRVQRTDGESPITALGAAGMAQEMPSAAARGIGKGCIDDLEQLAVLAQ